MHYLYLAILWDVKDWCECSEYAIRDVSTEPNDNTNVCGLTRSLPVGMPLAWESSMVPGLEDSVWIPSKAVDMK